jgi:chaperonin GroES
MTLTPLEDKVLLSKLEDSEDATASGILLVSQTSKSLNKGEVVAVGPGHLTQTGTRVQLDVVPGDTVLYQASHGIDYEDQILVSATSIVAKL